MGASLALGMRTGSPEGAVNGPPARAASRAASRLRDALALNAGIVLAYLVIRNGAVPAHNELIYLLHLAREWNPTLLAGDWTFAGPLPSHLVFNVVFGPLTLWMPLEAAGWAGRLLSWALILVALFQLGRHFGIPRWMTTASICCWVFFGQSVVGGEWILGPFEAKGIAYALLLFSLSGFIRQGVVVPSMLLGLAFSFHPLVGLWGALAVGLSLVILRYPARALLTSGCYVAVFALPGLIPLLTAATERGASDVWRFVVLVVMPYHFDPLSFEAWKVGVLLALLAFNWLHVRSTGPHHALRFLLVFQTILGAFFVAGYAARAADNYTILQLMPCRLFPVLVPLFFFFTLAKTLREARSPVSGQALLAAALLVPLLLAIPAKLFVDHVVRQRPVWTWLEEDDLMRAFKWLAANTPASATAILPPWRKDSFYFARRAQVANWWVLRFDQLTEWRRRLESVAGDLSGLTDGTEKVKMTQTVSHYSRLTEADIAALAERYHARYLVTGTSYSYPVLHVSGEYKVYSLDPGFVAAR